MEPPPNDFAAAVDRDAPDLLRYLQRRLGRDDAADALAEVMIAAWRRSDAMPVDPEQSRMWMFGIARNVLANNARGERRRSRLADRLRMVLVVAPLTETPSDEGIEVRDAIARLSPDHAELVRLVNWEGFSLASAGEILGIPASTARTWYQKARKELRAALLTDSGQLPR
jgi:RNA polymerase sigma-70 factor (ECF subfamily)